MPVYGPNVTISHRVLRANFGNSQQCSAFIRASDLFGSNRAATARAAFNGTVMGNIFFVSCKMCTYTVMVTTHFLLPSSNSKNSY